MVDAKMVDPIIDSLINDINKDIPITTVKNCTAVTDPISERLISTLERHIVFLEEENKRKDIIINRLINSLHSKNIREQENKTIAIIKDDKDRVGCNKNIVSIGPEDVTLLDDKYKYNLLNKHKQYINYGTGNMNNNTNNDESYEHIDYIKQHKVDKGNKENKPNKKNGRKGGRETRIDNDNDDNNNNNNNTDHKKKKKVTCVIGDSMVKNIKGWEMNKELKDDFVVVKSFSGATTSCMDHYLVPAMEKKPDNVILHVGTNDLKSVDTANKIAGRIIDMAVKCITKFSINRVVVSGIVTRGDDLNGKAESVNNILKGSCLSRNIPFMSNDNIELYDLNNSNLHLNRKGTNKLTANILDFIAKA